MAERYKLTPVLGISNDMQMLRSFVPEFREHGYGLLHAVDPDAVEKVIDEYNPKVILLDEAVGNHFPEDFEKRKVIAILNNDSPEHRADVMESGVEDYLIKPIKPSDARYALQTIERRRAIKIKSIGSLQIGGLNIDIDRREVCYNEGPIHLTPTEFDLLVHMVKNGDMVSSKESLVDLFNQPNRVSGLNGLKVYLGYLNKKLKAVDADVEIANVRKIGWKLTSSSPQ